MQHILDFIKENVIAALIGAFGLVVLFSKYRQKVDDLDEKVKEHARMFSEMQNSMSSLRSACEKLAYTVDAINQRVAETMESAEKNRDELHELQRDYTNSLKTISGNTDIIMKAISQIQPK